MRAGSNSHADSRPGARQERAAGVAHRIRQVPRATVLRYVPSPVAFPSSSNPGPRFASSVLSCLVMYIQLQLRTAHQAIRTIRPPPTCGGRARQNLPCAPSSAASPHTSPFMLDSDVIHSSHLSYSTIGGTKKSRLGEKFALKSRNLIGRRSDPKRIKSRLSYIHADIFLPLGGDPA